MILTVTPNPALDLTWQVDRLSPGASHRVQTGAARAGGKGLNVARVLHALGHDVLALATVGGSTGAEFSGELERSGIPHRLLAVAGETRRSLAIVDRSDGETSVLNEYGAPLATAETAALGRAVIDAAADAAVVALCGSLPPGLSPDDIGSLVEALVRSGTRVIVDTSGPALLAAARAGAHAVKPNREELAEVTGQTDPGEGAAALLELGARLALVSLGRDGLLLRSRSDAAGGIRARLPRVLHGNATGAGDAAVAAIAAALAETPDLDADTSAARVARESLARRATAWSASAVLMPLAGEVSPERDALETEVVITTAEEES